MRFLRIRFYYCYRRLLFPACVTLLILATLLLLNPNSGNNDSPVLDSSRHLPLLYWYHRSIYPKGYRNSTCARAPSPRRIEHSSPYWQVVRSNSGNVLAASAFWDERFGSAAVRVLVYSDLKELGHFICQLWYFNRKDPVIVSARDIYAWNDADDHVDEIADDIYDEVKPKLNATEAIVEPHVLSCNVPNASEAPTAVSLVNAPCAGATNMLNVQGAPIKDHIADQLPGLVGSEEETLKMTDVEGSKGVCVCAILPPHMRNVSARLAEWIELLKLFGVGRIYLYVTVIHPSVRSVINHYQWTGFVVVSYFSEPLAGMKPYYQNEKNLDGPSKLNYRKKQQVIYNDCLYRAIGWYRWVLPLRLDDMIVPLRDGILEKLAVLESQKYQDSFDAFSFVTYLFSPRAADHPDPTQVRMVDHEWRRYEPSTDELLMRCLNRIDMLLVIQEHRPLWCGEGPMRLSDGTMVDRSTKMHFCQFFSVDPNVARVHAHGASCTECQGLVSDTRIQRWRQVSMDVDRVLKLTQHRNKREN